jgi:hypothetical protein
MTTQGKRGARALLGPLSQRQRPELPGQHAWVDMSIGKRRRHSHGYGLGRLGSPLMSLFIRPWTRPVAVSVRSFRSNRPYQLNHGPTFPDGIPPPLRGIKVVDLTRVLAGPAATMVCF